MTLDELEQANQARIRLNEYRSWAREMAPYDIKAVILNRDGGATRDITLMKGQGGGGYISFPDELRDHLTLAMKHWLEGKIEESLKELKSLGVET